MGDGSASRGTEAAGTEQPVAPEILDILARRPQTHVRLLADSGDKQLVAKERRKKRAREGRVAATLQYAASRLDGGRESFLVYARSAASAHPEIKPFLEHYDGITQYERQKYTLDVLAQQAGISPRILIEAVAGEAFEQGVNVANLIAAHHLPEVVRESVKVAVTRKGVKDREMLMQHHGFLPVPKGTTINIQNIQRGGMSDLPDFEQSVVSLGEAARSVERLPEGSEGTIDVEPEEEELKDAASEGKG